MKHSVKRIAGPMPRLATVRAASWGQIAVKAATPRGDAWVKELLAAYIKGNIDWTRDFVKKNLPQAVMTDPEGILSGMD